MCDFTDECPDGKCLECWGNEIEAEAVAYDPREPPMEEDLCLCDCCFITAAEEQIDELKNKIAELQKEIRKWRRNTKRLP